MIIEKYQVDDIVRDIQFDEDVYLNITLLGKQFGKQSSKWLDNKQTSEYMEAFAESKNLLTADLVRVKKGGNDKNSQGTWIHPKLAIMFSRWLNPSFAVWCDDKIEELLQKGIVAATPEIQEELNALTPQIKSIQRYIRRTGGGVRMPKLIGLFGEMEQSSRTIGDYRNTIAKLTNAASVNDKEDVYNKLIRGTYKAYNDGAITRRTEEDILQILNANLIKLLRRRQTDLVNRLSNPPASPTVSLNLDKYLDEIADLKTQIEDLQAGTADPRPIQFELTGNGGPQEIADAQSAIVDEDYAIIFSSVLDHDDNKAAKKYPDWKGDSFNSNGRSTSGAIWENDGYYYASVGISTPPYNALCKLELFQHKTNEEMYVGVDDRNVHFGTFNNVTGAFIVYRKK